MFFFRFNFYGNNLLGYFSFSNVPTYSTTYTEHIHIFAEVESYGANALGAQVIYKRFRRVYICLYAFTGFRSIQ